MKQLIIGIFLTVSVSTHAAKLVSHWVCKSCERVQSDLDKKESDKKKQACTSITGNSKNTDCNKGEKK